MPDFSLEACQFLGKHSTIIGRLRLVDIEGLIKFVCLKDVWFHKLSSPRFLNPRGKTMLSAVAVNIL